MTALNRTTLNANANANLADNTAGDISASDIRSQAVDLADSAFLHSDIAANGVILRTASGTYEAATLAAGIVQDGTELRAIETIAVAASDEATPLTAGTGKVTFHMPYAFVVTGVKASLTTAQTSGSILTIDINEAGTSILSTKLTIDNGEKTSATAVTPAVISDAALAADAEITVDLDQIGDGTATGLKVYVTGYQPA